jgi:hypothetical protein
MGWVLIKGPLPPWSSGHGPRPVRAGQAAVDECAEIDCGTTELQPGVVLVDAEVAQFDPPSTVGGGPSNDPVCANTHTPAWTGQTRSASATAPRPPSSGCQSAALGRLRIRQIMQLLEHQHRPDQVRRQRRPPGRGREQVGDKRIREQLVAVLGQNANTLPGATSSPTSACASNNSRSDRVIPCITRSSHATRRTAVRHDQRWTSYSGPSLGTLPADGSPVFPAAGTVAAWRRRPIRFASTRSTKTATVSAAVAAAMHASCQPSGRAYCSGSGSGPAQVFPRAEGSLLVQKSMIAVTNSSRDSTPSPSASRILNP